MKRALKQAFAAAVVATAVWTTHAPGYNTGVQTCMGRSVVLDIGQSGFWWPSVRP